MSATSIHEIGVLERWKDGCRGASAAHLPLAFVSCAGDLGGYTTANGRTVKYGRIFRAASLRPLTEADVRLLNDDLGIKTQTCMEGHGSVSGEGMIAHEGLRQWSLEEVNMFVDEAQTDEKAAKVEMFNMSHQMKSMQSHNA